MSLAASADEVGSAQAVVASASASGEIGDRVLATGSVIHLNDLLTTDGTGEVQLLFADDTRMVVGPNASLVIDRFVFRGEKAENSFAVRALGGAFRFIGGKKDDADYAIRTPSATIGVRGTAFDFAVSREGTDLLLLEGVATLCGLDGQCAITGETCGILQAPVGQSASVAEERDRVRLASRNFPFIRAEKRLLAGFRLQGEDCLSSRSSSRVFGGEVPEREIRAMMEPPDPPAPEPPAPEPPAPAPEPPAVEAHPLGNPGNKKPVGRAGLNPGGKDFGQIGHGRSDVAPGHAGRGAAYGGGAGAGAGGGSASGSSGGGGAGAATGGADAGGAAAGGQGNGRGAGGNNAGGRGKGRGAGIGGGRSASADAGNNGRGRGRGEGGGNGGGAGSQR